MTAQVILDQKPLIDKEFKATCITIILNRSDVKAMLCFWSKMSRGTQVMT